MRTRLASRNVWIAMVTALWVGSASAAPRWPQTKILGWSSDGRAFAYVDPPLDAGELDEEGGGEASVSLATVVDARGWVKQTWVLRIEGKLTRDEKQRFAALPQKAAFDAWKATASPACASGKRAPDGKSEAVVAVKGKGVEGQWRKGRFEWSVAEPEDAAELDEEKKASFTLSVLRDGKLVPSRTFTSASTNYLAGTVSLCWSPDGKRVAWVAHRDSSMMRDPGDTSILVGPSGGPRIQLVANRSALDEAVLRVGEALDRAGFAVTSVRPSNGALRSASVVYAGSGWEEMAGRIATSIPGGATVGRVDWKTPMDVVVSLGDSALPSP